MRRSPLAAVLRIGHRLAYGDRITESACSFPPTQVPALWDRAGGGPDQVALSGLAFGYGVDAPDPSRSAIETGNRHSPSRPFVEQALGPA